MQIENSVTQDIRLGLHHFCRSLGGILSTAINDSYILFRRYREKGSNSKLRKDAVTRLTSFEGDTRIYCYLEGCVKKSDSITGKCIVKILKIRTSEKFVVITLKFETGGFIIL